MHPTYQHRKPAKMSFQLLGLLLVLLLTVPVFAQDIPAEATAEPSDVTLPAPAETTPNVEITAEAPIVEVTPEATAEAPISLTTFTDDFTSWTSDGWSGDGWLWVEALENSYVSTTLPLAALAVVNFAQADFQLSARLQLEAGNTAEIAVRSGEESYRVVFNALGAVRLYRGELLLAAGVSAAIEEPQWFDVTITAAGATLGVSVNGIPQIAYTDPAPLGAGFVVFSTGIDNTGSVSLDNVNISTLDAATTVIAVPATPVIIEATVAPIVEVTAEPETTAEPIAEMTAEPEATTEVAVEVTAEPEATAEPEIVEEIITRIVLSADFSTELTDWVVNGGNVVTVADDNSALLMAAGSTFAPAEALSLAEFQLTGAFNLLSAGDLTLALDGYTLAINTDGLVLVQGETMLASSGAEGVLALNTWHNFTLTAQAGVLALSIGDIPTVHTTLRDDYLLTSFTFSATDSLMLDNIVLSAFGAEEVLATALPLAVDPAAKVAPNLLPLVEAAINGDTEIANAEIAARQLDTDNDGLLHLLVWFAEGSDVTSVIAEAGGSLIAATSNNAEVFLPLSGIQTIVENSTITWLDTPIIASSSGPVGANSGLGGLQSFDALGIEDWHSATTAVRGAGVKIAVIDTGFNSSQPMFALSGEYTCLSSTTLRSGVAASNNDHGASVVQVICDIAPNSQVSLYQANSYGTLRNAIAQARVDDMDIILIALDLGVAATPGDGTGNHNNPAQDPYNQIAQARNEGRVVIAAAGNNNGRQLTFEYSGGAINFGVHVRPTEFVNVSYSTPNWFSTSNRPIISISTGDSNSAGSPEAGDQLSPAGCGVVEDMDGDGTNDSCLVFVSINGFWSGGGPVTVQIQVTGDGEIISPPVSALTYAGNIGRPADSPDVIAVGALCSDFTQNYKILPDSSKGPIFNNNGVAPASWTFPLNRVQTKPEIVSLASVDTSFGSVVPDINGDYCGSGFSGTSASAAHVAGMVALLKSNTTNVSMTGATVTSFNPDLALGGPESSVDNILNYLQSRVVEMPFGAQANGFDMQYGAGMTILGSPHFNLNNAFNSNIPPNQYDLTECASFLYVGLANPGDALMNNISQLGTIAHPFLHPAHALASVKSPNTCVILMPGEYVSPLLINGIYGLAGDDPSTIVASYDDVTSAVNPPSIFWMNAQYYDENNILSGDTTVSDIYHTAQLYFNNGGNGVLFSGFNFVFTKTQAGNTGIGIREPQAAIFYGSLNSGIRRSTMGEVVIDGVTYTGWNSTEVAPIRILGGSHGTLIEDNTFLNNRVPAPGGVPTTTVEVQDSGTNANRVRFKFNEVRGNRILNSSFGPNDWAATFYAENSAVDVINNAFVANTAETIIQTQTPAPGQLGGDLETRIMGNVILSNTTDSNDVFGFGGPIVNIFNVRNFYFLNNTVINNQTMDSLYGALIMRGDAVPDNFPHPGSITSDLNQKWEIHNNLIYDNIIDRLVTDAFAIDENVSYECDRISSTTNNLGAQHNWWYANIRSDATPATGGVCEAALQSGPNDNILGTDPSTHFLGYYLNTDIDPDNNIATPELTPDYYGLRQMTDNPQTFSLAVDFGDEDLNNILIPTDFDRDFSGRNNRVIDMTIANPNPPPARIDYPTSTPPGATLGVIDIGAFEFSPLIINDDNDPDNPDFTLPPFLEDSPIQIDMDAIIVPVPSAGNRPLVEGGFGELTFTINSYAVAHEFSTHCTYGNFTNQNRGFDVTQTVIKYCPPLHYYTDDVVTSNPDINAIWPNEVVVNYTVTDESGTSKDGILRFAITPTDDTPLSATAGYHYTATGSEGAVIVQLRPYVVFNPFEVEFAQDDAADFPYIYSNPQEAAPLEVRTCENEDLFDTSHLTAAFSDISVDGKITIATEGGESGCRDFTYDVTDRNGNTVQMRVTLRIFNTIPVKGLYDDTSFVFVYTNSDGAEPGDWIAESNQSSINNTLHTTATAGDYATLKFRGTGFVLYMNGRYNYGEWQLRIFRETPAVVELNPINWTLEATSNGNVYKTTYSDGPVTLNCSTRTQSVGTNLRDTIYGNYTVACEGATYGLYGVQLINQSHGYAMSVDAVSILDNTIGDPNPDPLQPGYYDVDQLGIRNLFNAQWQQISQYGLSNGVAFATKNTGSLPAASFSFTFTNATGFALGTMLDYLYGASYRVCVQNLTDAGTPGVCQDYSNTPNTMTTFTTFNTFRPFWGYAPDEIYQVTVSNINVPANGRLVIDSIIIYPSTLRPDGVLLGTFENDQFEKFVFAGGLDDSWVHDTYTYSYSASNGTVSTMSYSAGSFAGPFTAFEIDANADTIYFKYIYTYIDSTQWYICVDRALGTAAANDFGNCIIVNARPVGTEPAYRVVNTTTGALTNGDELIQATLGQLIIKESMFHNDTWGPGANGKHTIEMFSVTNEPFNVDRVTVLNSNGSLPAGSYEDFTGNIQYFAQNTPGTFTPVTPTLINYTTNFYEAEYTLDTLGAYYDSGGSVVHTGRTAYGNPGPGGVGNAIAFNIQGTGFAPIFRLDYLSDAVKICWMNPAKTAPFDSAEINDVLSNGMCHTVDNEAPYTVYQAKRPILGLPNNTYTVVVQMQHDNNLPAQHIYYAAPLQMWFDGVNVYNTDPATLTPLTYNVKNETSYINRAAENKFYYYGTGWRTDAIYYLAQSNADYDTIINPETAVGAGVMFRVDSTSNNANALVIYRDMSYGYSDYEVCSYPVGAPQNRRCSKVDNDTGTGNQIPVTVYLNDTPASNVYIVTITGVTRGILSLDAIKPVTTTPLTKGIHDDHNPSIHYDASVVSLAVNGDMESTTTNAVWTDVTPVSDNARSFFYAYSGFYSWGFRPGAGGGIQSQPFAAQINKEYTVLGRVLIPTNFNATLTMQLYNGGTPVGPTATLDANTIPTGLWHPLRFAYTSGANQTLTLRLTSSDSSGTTTVYLDAVHITEGGLWQTELYPYVYYGNSITRSATHGAEASFEFTGTGYSIATLIDSKGGETEICYGTVTPNTCLTYQNEHPTYAGTVTRTVVGLPSNTYQVRIRDVEDGYSDTIYTYTDTTTRPIAYTLGSIAIDFVQIYDETLPPAVTTSVDANDDYAIGGKSALQLLPQNRWRTFSGSEAFGYSNNTYVGSITQYSFLSYYDAGNAAALNLSLGASGAVNDEATVIIQAGYAYYSSSRDLLACVGGADGKVTYHAATTSNSLTGSTHCTLTSKLQAAPQVAFNKNNLPLLENTTASPVNRVLSLTTLTPGYFIIDGYQVIYGNQLTEGYYEDTIGNGILQQTGTWATDNFFYHSGGTALVGTGAATMTFRIHNSTGFSLLTAFDYLGGNVNIRVQGEGALTGYDESFVFDTFTYGARYQSPYTVAGLKQGDYTITISPTGPQPASRVVIDAIQVYGTLGSLGSLYDDAAKDTNGKLLLTYGPKNNNAWSVVTSDYSYLNQTYHSTSTAGATVSFEVGATKPATGIIIYNGYFTNTSVNVCWTKLTGTPVEPFCTLEALNGLVSTSREVNAPTGAPYVDANGHYNVTITNLTPYSYLYLDAIQVREGNNLVEGIYEATKLFQLDPTDAVNFNGTWTTPFNYANSTSGSGGASVEFTIEGARGFSILLSELYYSTTDTYTICVNTGTTAGTVGSPQCNTINGGTATTPVSLTRPATALGDYALTYVGLNPTNLYTVRLHNTATPASGRTLILKSVHVLGDKPALQITTTGRVENNDPQMRFLPFGGMTLLADGLASGLSESYGTTRGGGAYFEFRGKGFEYGRLAFVGFADVDICYGALNTPSNNPTACVPVDSVGLYVHQTTQLIDTNDAVCDTANGCWVTIRNREQAISMTLDFIRLFDPTAPMTAGVYEENYPALQNFSGTAATGGTYTLNPASLNVNPALLDYYASGYASRAYYDQAPDSAKFGGMFFRMSGTGFAVAFTRDYTADAIQICYQQNATTPQQVINQSGGGANGCQKFENNLYGIVGQSKRTILGLPNGTYGVTVQMLGDDGLPVQHQYAFELPVTMKVDTITIYNNEWFAAGNASWTAPTLQALDVLTPGTRYEANYTNRVTDNRFYYYGNWSTVTDYYASALNIDQATKAGSGIVFRTNGANSLTLYSTVSFGNSPLLMCARAINMPLTQETTPNCQTLSTSGALAYQQPISFKFHPSNVGEYVVWITSLDDGNFYVDAIELVDTTQPLTAGLYETTKPRINYDSDYVNLITNGTMESAGSWTAVSGATLAQAYWPYYDGYTSYGVTTTTANQGIESASFNLTAGTTYVVKARVYLYSGEVKMRLSTPNGMLEATQNGIYNWYTFYQEFTPGLTGANKLQFLSSGASNFYIDSVSLSEMGKGTWETSYYLYYSGGSARRSKTPGAGATFDFTGTGFEIGMPRDPMSGEAQICYGLKATFPVGANCFIYQQEYASYDYDIRRLVAGLPLNTYTVRVRDAEDGYSTTLYSVAASPRPSFTGLNSGILLDYVQIFNEPVAPMTASGFYNENAASGTRHLQTYPPTRWDDFTYPYAGYYTEQTYTAPVDQYGFLSYYGAGHTAIVNAEVQAGEPLTVILYGSFQYYYQSSQLLVCVGPQATGVKMSGTMIWTGFQFEVSGSTDCVLKTMALSDRISVNSADLPELAVPGAKTIMFTTLSPGTFYVDGFQIVGGNKLTPGVYDSFLPDSVLDFNNAVGTGEVESGYPCNNTTGWCQNYVYSALGSYTSGTSQPGAGLNFNIEGTGFSIIATTDYSGGDLRICFKPSISAEAFPSLDDLNPYNGNPPTKNDVWCDTVTTNTLSWDIYNAERYNPLFAYQYGFSYYGLPYGEYSVDVRVIDQSMLYYESVQIDGVLVFDQADVIMQPGVYDNTALGLMYEPTSAWTSSTSFFGLPYGPMNKTVHTTNKAGSLLQMVVSGNAVTLFQSTGYVNSRDIRFCLIVAGETVPCDLSTNDELAFAITNFSQYGYPAYGVPVMIYGLGEGEHTIIMENRDHNYIMSVDAIRVQE